MRRRRGQSLAAIALVVACAAAISQTACDGEDLSGLEILTLEAADDDGAAVAAWTQPYVGRLAVDYGLTNRSGVPASFRLRAQATTSGDPDDTACERLAREAGRDIDAVPDAAGDATSPDPNAALTVIRDFDDVVSVTLPDGQASGWVGLRIPADGEFVVRSDVAANLTIRADDGTEILPLATDDTTDCAAIQTERRWDLEATTWRLRIEGGAGVPVRLWIEQSCPDVRTVPNTCPGAAATIVEEDLPDVLADGGFVSGRIHDSDLGIGDQVTVELSCVSGVDCAGDLELFFVVTPLECRTDNDCTNTETCTTDAYCVRASTGCASVPPTGSAGAIGMVIALLLLRRRRR